MLTGVKWGEESEFDIHFHYVDPFFFNIVSHFVIDFNSDSYTHVDSNVTIFVMYILGFIFNVRLST